MHGYYEFPNNRWSENGIVNTVMLYVRQYTNAWQSVNTMANFQAIRAAYNDSANELGCRYNGEVQPAFVNGWTKGTRFTIYPVS